MALSTTSNNISAATSTNAYTNGDDDNNKKATLDEKEVVDDATTTTIVAQVLATIDATSHKRLDEGFCPFNFTMGVLNCLLVALVFGSFPQHFWLLYIVEAFVLIPVKPYSSWHDQPLNGILYHFDYCWVVNIMGAFTLIALSFLERIVGNASEEVRKQVYMTVVGVCCGPLLGAIFILPFVQVVFHDVIAMSNLFVHIYPPMLMYTFLWNTDAIRTAWPQIFVLDYLDNINFFPTGAKKNPWLVLPGNGLGTIAGNTNALYLLWFVPYMIWMLTVGLNLLRKNRRRRRDGSLIVARFDTVFHATVRHGLYESFGNIFFVRPPSVSRQHMQDDNYETRDFLVYMGIHAVMSYLVTMVLAYGCFHYKYLHAALIALLTVVCVYRGSQQYTYYVITMYGKAVRDQFGDDVVKKEE